MAWTLKAFVDEITLMIAERYPPYETHVQAEFRTSGTVSDELLLARTFTPKVFLCFTFCSCV
jgi:hypothetical protein